MPKFIGGALGGALGNQGNGWVIGLGGLFGGIPGVGVGKTLPGNFTKGEHPVWFIRPRSEIDLIKQPMVGNKSGLESG